MVGAQKSFFCEHPVHFYIQNSFLVSALLKLSGAKRAAKLFSSKDPEEQPVQPIQLLVLSKVSDHVYKQTKF